MNLITDSGNGVTAGWLEGTNHSLFWIDDGKCEIFIWLNGN